MFGQAFEIQPPYTVLVPCWCRVGAVLVSCWCRVGAVLVPCWCRVVHRVVHRWPTCGPSCRPSCGRSRADKSCGVVPWRDVMKLCSMGENHPWTGRRRPMPGHPQGCGHYVGQYEAAGATSSFGGNVGGCKLFHFI